MANPVEIFVNWGLGQGATPRESDFIEQNDGKGIDPLKGCGPLPWLSALREFVFCTLTPPK